MSTLNDICYEQIKDSFYYGLFGDFKLVIDKNTGCFNATKLCEMTGKKFYNWTSNKNTKDLFAHYKVAPGIPGATLYEIKGSQHGDRKEITGQYICKELLLSLATWISIDFYFKCSIVINDYFIAESRAVNAKAVEESMAKLKLENEEKDIAISQQKDKIDELLESNRRMEIHLQDIIDQNNELLDQNATLDEKVDKIQQKLDIAVVDRAPLPKSPTKQECFILLKFNNPNHPWEYYTIRAQKTSATTSLKAKQKLHPSLAVLINILYHPNSKTLYVRIKEDLKKRGVEFNCNNIRICDKSKITEAELVNAMRQIDATRLNLADEVN